MYRPTGTPARGCGSEVRARMHPAERVAIAVRRSKLLKRAHFLWRAVRPAYLRWLRWLGRGGLVRRINGTDSVRVIPELYTLSEECEPEVWSQVMREIRPGDTVADVGANVGLYALAAGNRVGPRGRVVAFEPEPSIFDQLRRNVELNRLTARVEALPYVVGDTTGEVSFVVGRERESHVAAADSDSTTKVKSVTLSGFFEDRKLDVLKIDVEGYEERVVRGALELLRDALRAPRAIFIEVHPAAWERFGVGGDTLIGLLRGCDYGVSDLSGNPVTCIREYGEIVARRNGPPRLGGSRA